MQGLSKKLTGKELKLLMRSNVIFKIDFRETGRNLKRLGLENLTLDEIRNVFIEGTPKRLF